ncbi:hypothetical protein GIB67_016399 [Kingdonia uniflora]|uniref:Cytochrome P450 n=1 Tax=Kingdonia uniflora TaxID=39325 RepID=A0A7J7MGZ9_9MAGN|nr:hypothetical protein GIB67_016399 [Kingdonia uniflora]
MIANKGESEEDLVDILFRLQDCCNLEFPITTDNIKAVILGVSDTSATVIEWAMSELMKNPRAMEKAQAELVIKETLRLHPPTPLLIPRECREQCEIDRYEIPTKTKVIVNAWVIGRDPEHWKDSESFEPERFDGGDINYKGTNFEFITFCASRRMCPGILFGIANVELPPVQLVYQFDWKLPNRVKPNELDMTESLGATIKTKNKKLELSSHFVWAMEKNPQNGKIILNELSDYQMPHCTQNMESSSLME